MYFWWFGYGSLCEFCHVLMWWWIDGLFCILWPSYSRKVIEADGVTTTRHHLAPSVVKRLKTSYHMMILDSFLKNTPSQRSDQLSYK